MRSFIALAFVASASAHAAEPYCALPTPVSMASDQQMAVFLPPPEPSVSIPGAAMPTAAPLSDAISTLPFVKYVRASGSVVTDFGLSHGVRSIAAKSGDEFMIFQVADDGQSAVSGAVTEITPAQLATLAGDNVTELGSDHGFRGLHVRSGAHFQVFYVTPDQQRVIPGVLYDAEGKDLRGCL